MKPEDLIDMCYEYFKMYIKKKLDKEGIKEQYKVCKT